MTCEWLVQSLLPKKSRPATCRSRKQQLPEPPGTRLRSPLLITLTSAQQTASMADKMDVDATNGEKEEEKVGPAPNLPADRSTDVTTFNTTDMPINF
jgi:hypothetical protein